MNMNLPPILRGTIAATMVVALGGAAAGCASPPKFGENEKTIAVDEYKDGKAFIHGIAQAAGVITTFECNGNDLEVRATKPGWIPGTTDTSDPTTIANSKTCDDGTITPGEAVSLVSRP